MQQPHLTCAPAEMTMPSLPGLCPAQVRHSFLKLLPFPAGSGWVGLSSQPKQWCVAALSQDPAGILAALVLCWGWVRGAVLSARGWERLSFSAESLAEQCGQPGAVVCTLLLYKGLLLIFAHLKGHSSLSTPLWMLLQDGFACSWSSLFNMRVSPLCTTSSTLCLPPTQLWPQDRSHFFQILLLWCIIYTMEKYWGDKVGKISLLFLKSASRWKTKNIELKKKLQTLS